jgi:DNA adenine methylase
MTMTRAALPEAHGDNIARPFLKWVGGKRQLVPELMGAIKALKGTPLIRKAHYYEPFIGGAALFFAMRAQGWAGRATLGDANEHLVRTYLGVRNDVEGVINALKSGPRYSETEYYQERECFIRLLGQDDAVIAAWVIYMNRTGFNGLWRVNGKGEYNVPFGRYTNPRICDEINLRACAKALHDTTFKMRDFEKTVSTAERGDLVYFDPPYVPVNTTSDFTSYTRNGFTIEDQVRLRDCALKLKRRGVHVILSNAHVPKVHELYYGEFKLIPVEARRNVNSDASKRGVVGEVIIT